MAGISASTSYPRPALSAAHGLQASVMPTIASARSRREAILVRVSQSSVTVVGISSVAILLS